MPLRGETGLLRPNTFKEGLIMIFGTRSMRNGQGMVEYILIIALVALAIMAGVRIFKGNLHESFSSAGTQIQNEVGPPR